MVNPSLFKLECFLTFKKTYKSPDGPPFSPALPSPETLNRVPLSTPAGILIFNFFHTCLTPFPPQALQGSLITCPVPPQFGHSATWVKLPKGVRVALLT